MKDLKYFNDKLKYTFMGKPWFGDSVWEILSSIPFKNVNLTIDGLNDKTIAHLVLHMISWQNFVIHKLEGNIDFNIELGSPLDWPKKEISTNEEWNATKEELLSQNLEIGNKIKKANEIMLSEITPGMEYSNSIMIDGITHHNLYHIGQISLMNKILNQTQ